MVFFRNFKYVQIEIRLDDELYRKQIDVFCSLFTTYSSDISAMSFDMKKVICISSSDLAHSYLYGDCNYYYTCNTDDSNWISALIEFLHYCYFSILSCTVLHGSCVKINENGVLILGARKSGKTTLTHYLINQNDTTYLDDDSIYLYDNSLVGFNTPIRMRSDCMANSILLEKSVDTDNEIRYVYNVNDFCKVSMIKKPQCIIFPNYNKDIFLEIKELRGYDLYNQIISNVKESTSLRTMFKDISRYFSNLPAYAIQYNSCDKVLDFLKESIKKVEISNCEKL